MKPQQKRFPCFERHRKSTLIGRVSSIWILKAIKAPQSGFDADFFEFQQEFWFKTIAHFVTAFDTPMVGGLVNPNPQQNNVPDTLKVDLPTGNANGASN